MWEFDPTFTFPKNEIRTNDLSQIEATPLLTPTACFIHFILHFLIKMRETIEFQYIPVEFSLGVAYLIPSTVCHVLTWFDRCSNPASIQHSVTTSLNGIVADLFHFAPQKQPIAYFRRQAKGPQPAEQGAQRAMCRKASNDTPRDAIYSQGWHPTPAKVEGRSAVNPDSLHLQCIQGPLEFATCWRIRIKSQNNGPQHHEHVSYTFSLSNVDAKSMPNRSEANPTPTTHDKQLPKPITDHFKWPNPIPNRSQSDPEPIPNSPQTDPKLTPKRSKINSNLVQSWSKLGHMIPGTFDQNT